MNKLFTKIAGLFLGLTMAVGVGVAAISNNNDTLGVNAASQYSATMAYTTATTTNMQATGNASKVGLDANVFTVDATKGNNFPGLNKSKYIAIYSQAGCTVTVSLVDTTKVIDNISVTYTSNKYAGLTVTANDSPQTSGNSFTINASKFILSNSSSDQVRIKTLVINYSDKSSSTTLVTSVSVSPSTLSLDVGETSTLTATVLPDNASNKNVTWASSNTNVATVSNGVVTAVSAGTADITATAADGSGKSGKCTVTVNQPSNPGSGESVTVSDDFSQNNYTNQQTISSVVLDGVITVSFNKGSNSNDPKYYSSGTAIRVYGGNYFTVAAIEGYKITSITLTFGTSDGSNAITTDSNTYSDGTWTGSQTSVKFTIGGTTGNRRIKAIEVTYESIGDVQIVATNVVASWNDGKGTYYNGNNNNQFSTEHLSVYTATESGEIVDRFDEGKGFTFTLSGTTYDATTAVKTINFTGQTAGEFQLTVKIGDLTPATLTLNVVTKQIVEFTFKSEQTTSYVSYIDSFKVDATFSAKFNDGSEKVSDLNIVTNIYTGNSNLGELVGTTTKAYSSYSSGFNLTDEMGISIDKSIHKRLAYATAQTFYLEFYLEDYPTAKLGTVINITMPELEVEDAIDTKYYIGSSYDTVANAKLVSGTKERTLNNDEFTLDPSEITPSDENPITVTATFNECQTLTDIYVINPVQPATIDSVEIYDKNGDYISENDIVYFKAGDEFKLYEKNSSSGVIFSAIDTDDNILEYTDYSDITFVIADDAGGTNKTNLEPGETVYLGMDEKFVILTYVNGDQKIKFSYQLTVQEATVIEYEAPVTGGPISKTTEIAVGDIVYLVCEGVSTEFSEISTTTTKYGIGVELTSNGVTPLTVCEGAISGTFAFKFGTNYLTWASGNSLNKDATISENTSWYVSFDGSGNAIIENHENETDRRIGWNNNNNSLRFANYKDTTLLKDDLVTYETNYYAVQLYKASGSTAGNGVEYLKSVIDTFRLNSSVSNKYGLSICNKDSGIYSYENWDLVKEIYEGLDSAELKLLDVQDKYACDKITYNETFEMLIAADSGTLPLNLPFMNLASEESNVSILVIAVAIGMVGVLAFVSIRKRRENQQ